jgi:cytochrome c oxidase subunit III
MIVTLLFLTVLAAIAAWWLTRQGLGDKPWLETGVAGEAATGPIAPPIPAAKIGLGVFIVVASSLLVLMVSAYSMRMQMADWSPPPQPRLLWVNTGVLVLASVALHRASVAARDGTRRAEVQGSLIAGAAAGVIFLIGQILAWQELAGLGYLPANNPADAFFYLITAAHGLHVLGGLAALGRTIAGLRRGVPRERLRLGVELCATYWHFLLLAWIVLFSMLAFSPSFAWLYAICTAPFR